MMNRMHNLFVKILNNCLVDPIKEFKHTAREHNFRNPVCDYSEYCESVSYNFTKPLFIAAAGGSRQIFEELMYCKI